MRFLVSAGVGTVVGVSWLLLWGLVLKMLGLPLYARAPVTRAQSREQVKELGKARYVLIFGIGGWGLSMGLAMTAADIAGKSHVTWALIAGEILFFSTLGGWSWGAWMWNVHYRD